MRRKLTIAIIVSIAVFAIVGGGLALNGYFGGGGDIPADTFTNGLVGYWNFDEGSGITANDSSGNGNDGTAVSSVPTIAQKAVAGTNANSASANSVTLAYDHPGGDLLVFFRYFKSTIGSGHSVAFNGQNIPVLDVTDAVGTFDDAPISGVAYLADVDAANDTITVSWTGDGTSRGIMAFSISGANGLRAQNGGNFELARFGSVTNPSITLDTEEGDLVIAAVHWRNSGDDVQAEGSGQTQELNDDSPTRQQASSKPGEASSTTLSWTMTGTDSNQAINVYGVAFRGELPTWTAGKPGNGGALDFDGTGNYVDIGNVGGTVKTITFWVKADDNTSRKVIDIDGTDHIELDSSGDVLATSFPAATVYVDGVVASSTSQGIWHFVAITDSTGVSPTDMDIGAHDIGGTPGYFDGQIDEVKIYNRALSAAEVKFHYNRGAPAAHWKFDEGSGSTAFDFVGSADGTLTAMEEADWVQGQFGTALDFGGTDEFVNVGDIGSTAVRTLSFWAKPQDTTEQLIELSASDSVEVSAGTVTVTGFGTETVYVDGLQTTVFPDDASWHHIVVVSDTDITADTVEIGRVGATHYVGQMDDVRIYDYARTEDEIRLDYNAGFAARFGGSPADWITQGLVGYWAFEEGSGQTAADSSGQGNNGTLGADTNPGTDDPTWTSGKAGNGGALNFQDDANDDFVAIANDDSLNLTTDFTVTTWIRLENTGAFHGIYRSGTQANRWLVGVHNTNKIKFTEVNIADNIANTALSSGVWYFAAFVKDGDSGTNVTMYLNGVADGTASVGTVATPSGEKRIGRGDDAFDGDIDEVRVYNRALSAEEVRYLYNQGDPVTHYKFEEGSGSTAFDSGIQDSSGTLTNMEEADWVQGQYGTALDFDGVDEYISLVDGTVPSSTRTVSMWIKADSFPDTRNALYFAGPTSGCNPSSQFLIVRSTGSLRFGTGCGSDQIGSTLSTGVWYHVVHVLSGVTDSKLYLNGVLDSDSTDTTAGQSVGAPNNALLARAWDSGNLEEEFDGIIDDVRIYNYARTEDEIRLDYNAGFAARFGGSPADWVTLGLAGYWAMEEGSGQTVADSTDQGNDGTRGTSTAVASNDPAWISGKAGNGGALDFDGSSDAVTIADSDSLDVSSITVSAWVYKKANHSDWAIIAGRQRGTAGEQVWNLLYANTADEEYDFTIYNGTSQVEIRGSASTDDLNTWVHVVGTYDGSTVKLYVNGVEEAATSTVGALPADTTNICIGASANDSSLECNSEFTNAIIDEVRIYNRALPADQVRYLYNQGGPIAHWKFDEGSGTTVFDSFGSSDGTASGTPAWVEGQFGSALDFDGSNFVTVSDNDSLDISGPITMAAWIQPSNIDSTRQDIVGKDSAYQIFIHTDNVVRFKGFGLTDDFSSGTGTTLQNNTWYHVVAVYDGTDMVIYVNGRKEYSDDAEGGSITVGTGDLGIGGSSSGTEPFEGIIDDARIYNYARSADEVLQDYNAGLSTHFR